MRPSSACFAFAIASLGAAIAGCGGDVQASGCFQHRDLEESTRIGLEIENACNTRGYCSLKVAYECGGQSRPVLSDRFEVPPRGTEVAWLDVDCASAWSYVKRWLCTEEGYPDLEDPEL